MKNKLDKYVVAYQGHNLYDFDNEVILNWYARRIVKYSKTAKSIMELGLGHGITTNIFSRYFKRHVVLEGSESVIENFKDKYPSCSAQIINTFFEKFTSNEKFDVIVAGFVLEHVDNPLEILTYIKKFLSPKGKIFITVPNAEALNRRLGYLGGILPDIRKLSKNDIIQGHKRYYTVKTLIEEIKSANFEVVLIEGIYLKPFTTDQILSLNLDKKIFQALCKVGVDYPELSLGILAQIKEIL